MKNWIDPRAALGGLKRASELIKSVKCVEGGRRAKAACYRSGAAGNRATPIEGALLLPLLAPLRHADRSRRCLLIGEDRK